MANTPGVALLDRDNELSRLTLAAAGASNREVTQATIVCVKAQLAAASAG